jgi:hypothetical protein
VWFGWAAGIPVFAYVGAACLFPSLLVGYLFYSVGLEQPLVETGSHFPVITLFGAVTIFLVPGALAMLGSRRLRGGSPPNN